MAKKSAASAKPVATVVETKHRLSKRGKLLLCLIAVLLLVVGGVWWWSHRSNPDDSAGQTSKGQPKTITGAYASRNYQAALDMAKAQAKSDDPASQLVLAAAYSNNKQYDAAYKIYDDLYAKGQLSGQDTMAAGEVAQGAGNNAKALEYYKEAETKLKSDKSRYAPRNLKYVQDQIKELQ